MEALPCKDEELLVDVGNNIKEGEMNLRQLNVHAAGVFALAQIYGRIFLCIAS